MKLIKYKIDTHTIIDHLPGAPIYYRWMYIGYADTGIFKSRFTLSDTNRIVNFTARANCMDIGMYQK